MFQNRSTKDESETSIRTFQSVRDKIENTFSKIEWRRMTKMGGKTYCYNELRYRRMKPWFLVVIVLIKS